MDKTESFKKKKYFIVFQVILLITKNTSVEFERVFIKFELAIINVRNILQTCSVYKFIMISKNGVV